MKPILVAWDSDSKRGWWVDTLMIPFNDTEDACAVVVDYDEQEVHLISIFSLVPIRGE